MTIWLLTGVIFIIAAVMTMTGRGGGNFYVVAMALSGIGMHHAAATGQFILFMSALAAVVIFRRKRVVEWRLVSSSARSRRYPHSAEDTFPIISLNGH